MERIKKDEGGGGVMKPNKKGFIDLVTVNHGRDKIDITHLHHLDKHAGYPLVEVVLSELHLKEDGARDGSPSLAMVLVKPFTANYLTQVSLNTLDGNLKKLGYKIVKNE